MSGAKRSIATIDPVPGISPGEPLHPPAPFPREGTMRGGRCRNEVLAAGESQLRRMGDIKGPVLRPGLFLSHP
jgi:hypothetical protein